MPPIHSLNIFISRERIGNQGNASTQGAGQPIVNTARPSPIPASSAPEPSLEDVRKATQEVQEAVRAMTKSLEFSIDQESGRTIVKLTDTETGETIRQIPSQDMIELSRNIDRLQGLLLSQKV